MQITPIKTERDYRAALKRIDVLMDAKAGSKAGDELDILVTLTEAWEARHHTIDAPNPAAAIAFAMEQRGLSRADMEPYIGSRARVSEILRQKRRLTLSMIRKLHIGLGIPAAVLIA